MAVNSRRSFEIPLSRKSQHHTHSSTSSPLTTKISTTGSPQQTTATVNRRVPVVYYLSRNGQLEHPHFIEVSLSSSDGLYLRDVMQRLNYLRGKGMAYLYSWSSKRSYRNGFVWQDLSENDFIHPSHGDEYILKGSELLKSSLSYRSYDAASSPVNKPESNICSSDDSGVPVTARTQNQQWSSVDYGEYKVYKTAAPVGVIAGKLAADASTQTDDEKRKMRAVGKEDPNLYGNGTTELSREEISPPSSSSSTETLEPVDRSRDVDVGYQTVGIDHHGSGRMKVSAALMQLITCGSTACESVQDGDRGCEMKEHGGRLSRDSQYHHV